MLDYKDAAKAFTYDREAGVLYWKERTHNTIRRKYIAGSSKGTKDGYSHVMFMGKVHPTHRIIMLLCYGHIPDNAEIDHINHVRDDNRLVNLRFVTKSGNRRNQSVSSKSTTGVTGVYFNKRLQKYAAQIKVGGVVHYLGIHDTLEEATAARAEANLKFNFHANHGK